MLWHEALKIWNAKHGGKYRSPAKGTPEYDEVKAILTGVEKPTAVLKAMRPEQPSAAVKMLKRMRLMKKMAKYLRKEAGADFRREYELKRSEEAHAKLKAEEAAKRTPKSTATTPRATPKAAAKPLPKPAEKEPYSLAHMDAFYEQPDAEKLQLLKRQLGDDRVEIIVEPGKKYIHGGQEIWGGNRTYYIDSMNRVYVPFSLMNIGTLPNRDNWNTFVGREGEMYQEEFYEKLYPKEAPKPVKKEVAKVEPTEEEVEAARIKEVEAKIKARVTAGAGEKARQRFQEALRRKQLEKK